jgi:glycosyltransferase involved in cell wall biosynthesis
MVHHEIEGLVSKPTPAALAGAMGRVMDDPAFAERMGAAAGERARAMTWPATIARLVVV